MIVILSTIMLLLLIFISGFNGLKTYICFYLNFALIILFIYLVVQGINILFLAVLTCIISSLISLFLLNGINEKTKSAFKSVFLIMIFMFILIYIVSMFASISGFTSESREVIGTYNLYINCSYFDLMVAVLLVCTMGTLIDTSISISTSLYEVYENNKNLSLNELYASGKTIGKDILSTTINTIYFASLGAIMTFVFWNYKTSFLEIINHKMLLQDLFEILCCFIASILAIPVSSYITAKNIKKL